MIYGKAILKNSNDKPIPLPKGNEVFSAPWHCELFALTIFLYERSQNGSEVYVWECKPMKKDVFGEYICEEKPIDIFFGIGEGRVYVEEGRFNTEDEGKKKLLDDNGYLIDNPKYRFREYEKDNNLFRYCKLG